NFYEIEGVRYVHTLDPKSGRPVAHRLLSASVFHQSCAWSDAWATALMASGDEAWDLAQKNDLEVLLIYGSQDGGFEERVTDGVSELRLQTEAPALAER
ncbi:MAG: FAD:protein FMN transferase, partial [Myxococcota bacterium]